MRARWISLVTVLALSSPDTVWGNQAFSLPLPELIGPVGYPGGIEIDFDFEREFTDVERVVLILRAVGTPALVRTCQDPLIVVWDNNLEEEEEQEPSCERKLVSFEFLVSLSGETTEQHTYTTVGDFRWFSLERAGVFQRAFGPYSFDQLRDGRGTLHFGWNHLLSIPENPITVLEPPAIEVLDAILLVEATPVAHPNQMPDRSRRSRGRPLRTMP